MEMEFFVPPEQAAAVVRALEAGALRLVRRRSACAPTTCACATTTPTSSATTPRGTADVEYLFPIGWSELEGIANRGDFDLTAARAGLGQEARGRRARTARRYVPHVIEPAAGVGRSMLAFLSDAYDEEDLGDGEHAHRAASCTRAWRRSRSRSCRWSRRTASPSWPREVQALLKQRMQTEYDEGGSIGKRYRRQDEIGTPWCVTIDHQSLEDRTVTLRDRDSLAQERVAIDELAELLSSRLAAPWSSPKAAATS